LCAQGREREAVLLPALQFLFEQTGIEDESAMLHSKSDSGSDLLRKIALASGPTSVEAARHLNMTQLPFSSKLTLFCTICCA